MNSKEYLELSEKTLSKEFHTDNVSAGTLLNSLNLVINASQVIDMYKKSLYYNKGNFPDNTLGICSYDKVHPDLLHAILGIYTEALELLEALVPALKGEDIDLVNISEEVGDLYWYIAIIHRMADNLPEDEYARNIAKLKARYGDKFSADKANNRDLTKEREILTGEVNS